MYRSSSRPLPQSVTHQGGDQIPFELSPERGVGRIHVPDGIEIGGGSPDELCHHPRQAMGLHGPQRGEGPAQVGQSGDKGPIIKASQRRGDGLDGVGRVQEHVRGGSHQAHNEVCGPCRIRTHRKMSNDSAHRLLLAQYPDGGRDAGGTADKNCGCVAAATQNLDLTQYRPEAGAMGSLAYEPVIGS